MPKKELTIFVVIDLILVAGAVVAAFQHVKIVYVIAVFGLLTAINGLFLIISIVRQPRA